MLRAVPVEDVGVDNGDERKQGRWKSCAQAEQGAEGGCEIELWILVSFILVDGGILRSRTRGTSAKTRKTAERTKVTTEVATRALVPCTLKCWGQRGSHHGLDVCCLLKTSRVWADVPRVATLIAAHSPMRTAWAVRRGAGLTFMILGVTDRLESFFFCWLAGGRYNGV